MLQRWHDRPVRVTPFVQLDTAWCKCGHGGLLQDAAVLAAGGIQEDASAHHFGVSIALGEYEIHWRSFRDPLLQRGLTRVILITSYDHAGLRAA